MRLTFYDDAQRPPMMLSINRSSTANQLYSQVAAEANVTSRFKLYYQDTPIQQCETPLDQIFQSNEVDVLLVLMVDGAGGGTLVSSCDGCPNDTGDDYGFVCGPCNNLTDDLIIDEIVDKREDAWIILCKVFKISANVRSKIEDNHEDNTVRCIDVMHHLYHSNTALTWDDVRTMVKSRDSHLATVISECKTAT